MDYNAMHMHYDIDLYKYTQIGYEIKVDAQLFIFQLFLCYSISISELK